MEDIKEKDIESYFSINENENNIFLILRDNSVIPKNLNFKGLYDKKTKEDKFLTIIFDIDDLNKDISDIYKYFENIIEEEEEANKYFEIKIEDEEKKICKDMKLNIIIKNCLVKYNTPLFVNDIKLELNKLYISDELYSMTPDLNKLFKSFKPKILILKSIKINSNLQLEKFFNFIINTECEELFLEDFFIELIIKKDNNDETYNNLDEYFYFEDGNIIINNYKEVIENKEIKENKKTNLKKLTLIDCPLFAITDDIFNGIKEHNDIEIDIDENSLLNPSMITRFRINKGLSDFCFDLDSYKLNKEGEDNYIENIKYIINKIIDYNNNEYNKLIFKNFDITKYEYITGENLTYIEEKNWILNHEEKERYKKFEEFDDEINKKIDKNLDKLSKVKSLVFDNCSNHFIQLILKFINSSKNDLDLLKLKKCKCGKEHFNINNILSLKITNLILFDTPLIIDSFPENGKTNLDKYDGKYGSIENCTIKISSLDQYCKENNLNYCNTLEIILELITKKGYITNLIFEMNALPIIMTYLISKEYCKDKGIKTKIPTYFEFTKLEKDILESKNEKEKKDKIKEIARQIFKEREKLISKTFNIFNKEKSKIILRKNDIKNKLENYDILTQYYVNEIKIDFGSDIFNLDIDYRQFFILNGIETIIFENCSIINYTNPKLGDQSIIKDSLFNLCEGSNVKCYKFDIKTINEVIFKNKGIEDLTYLFKFFSLEIEGNDLSTEISNYLKNVNAFFDNLKKTFQYLKDNMKEITKIIVINNVKERKEFYCLMQVLMFVEDEKSYKKYLYKCHENQISIFLPKKEELRKKIQDYFLKEQNEEGKEILSVYNYYYTSDDEKNKFGEIGKEKEEKDYEFGENKFKIKFNYKDPLEFFIE